MCGDEAGAIQGEIDVCEMMGSAAHLHVNACGKSVIIIAQTMDAAGQNQVSFGMGQKINFTFGGNVAHIFSKETERNLEF